MKLTLELLSNYNANPLYVEYLNGIGLLGADLKEILQHEGVPIDFLHFLKKYLDFDEEEISIYNQICRVDEGSRNIWYSKDVKNSANLMRSSYVTDSSNVRDSEDVYNSRFVFNSTSIKDSKNISDSENVSDSDTVLKSRDVSMSEQVARSKSIDWCENVFWSARLRDCSFIYQSEDLDTSHFCGFVKNSDHCLFCSGIENKSYYIFNEEVTPQEFEEVLSTLLEMLNVESAPMIKVNDDGLIATERFTFSPRYDSIFDGLSKEFYGWIGTLPNYSDDKFLSLFFRDRENLKSSEV